MKRRWLVTESEDIFVRTDLGTDFDLAIWVRIKIVNCIADKIENYKIEFHFVRISTMFHFTHVFLYIKDKFGFLRSVYVIFQTNH